MSSRIAIDKYYTPAAVANQALERAHLARTPSVCADTACGAGSLLVAAEHVLQAKHCLGIDRDSKAIRQLRRARPDWQLYVGDLLKRHRSPLITFPTAYSAVDLLILNPPFSLGPRKYISVNYLGRSLKCSIAMAHILRSLDLFRPVLGAIAVVPESLLYSDTDRQARQLLEQEFSLTELLQLNAQTFKGARVNSSFVQLSIPTTNTPESARPLASSRLAPIDATIIRGSLQMHAFTRVNSGALVIHSTALVPIAINGLSAVSDRTSLVAKGRLSGWMLLLPRVGFPKEEAFDVVYSKDEIQLSDCVIAIKFQSKRTAIAARQRIREYWQNLIDLYRGTGARYITVERLTQWLSRIAISDQNLKKQP